MQATIICLFYRKDDKSFAYILLDDRKEKKGDLQVFTNRKQLLKSYHKSTTQS
jgi:hypothetical protein